MVVQKLKNIKLPKLDCRIPNWDFNNLVKRVCPICSNSESFSVHIRPDSLNVRFCNKCCTFYVSPSPSEDQLSKFYSSYDKNHRREHSTSIKELLNTYKNMDPLKDFRISVLSKHMIMLNSKVLDIGFGRARFLYSLMKMGCIPYGIEIDKKAIKYAQALGIHNLHHGLLQDYKNDVKFNLIILDDLIEHPLNPMCLLREAADKLEKNGIIMIWTPNGQITKTELHPVTFRVDLEHMQYLTPESTTFIAKELNLNIVYQETMGFPNLIGIDKPITIFQKFKNQLKKTIKLIPGASFINTHVLKKNMLSISEMNEEKDKGGYHLFCILQKPV